MIFYVKTINIVLPPHPSLGQQTRPLQQQGVCVYISIFMHLFLSIVSLHIYIYVYIADKFAAIANVPILSVCSTGCNSSCCTQGVLSDLCINVWFVGIKLASPFVRTKADVSAQNDLNYASKSINVMHISKQIIDIGMYMHISYI